MNLVFTPGFKSIFVPFIEAGHPHPDQSELEWLLIGRVHEPLKDFPVDHQTKIRFRVVKK